MATYKQVQHWVKEHHGFMPKTCWIAHAKEICGLSPGVAPNRFGDQRAVACPTNKLPAIREAFHHFGMLKS